VLDGTDALLRRLKVGEPPPPGSVPGRPFDITEYTQAAATIGDATKQLQMLVTMLEHDAPAATRLGDVMQGHAERVVDHLYSARFWQRTTTSNKTAALRATSQHLPKWAATTSVGILRMPTESARSATALSRFFVVVSLAAGRLWRCGRRRGVAVCVVESFDCRHP
jgi:hypothetical protein